MISRIKEYLLYQKLKKKCQENETVRKGHWRYFRNNKHTRITPCIVKSELPRFATDKEVGFGEEKENVQHV